MPDIKDAKRQLHNALTEAGAMPHWELVATAQFLDQPDTLRLRVENGHLYVHGNAMTFAPAEPGGMADLKSRLNTAMATAMRLESERDDAIEQLTEMTNDRDLAHDAYENERAARVHAEAERDEARRQVHRIEEENGQLQGTVDLMVGRYREANGESITLQRKLYDALGQLGQEQRGREVAEDRCEELRRERDEIRAEADAARAFMRCAEEERDALLRKNAELRRQVDDWEAEVHKLRGASRTISIGPDGMHMGSLEDTSCTGRAPAEVGPSSFTMRGCRLAEGHAGPCEA